MKNIKSLSDSELLTEGKFQVKKEKDALIFVLHILREIESRKLHLERGYSSLKEFCTGYFGYEDSEAYRRVAAMRLICEIPEVEKKIEQGSLSLTAVNQATTFFRREAAHEEPLTVHEKKEVLEKLENKSVRECQKELIKLSPEAMLPKEERVRPLTDKLSELKLVVENEALEDMEDLKKLMSNTGLSLPKILHLLVKEKLLKIDPARKPMKAKIESKVRNDKFAAPKKSRYIPAHVKVQVWKRDQGRCSFEDPLTKKRCGSQYRIQLDHIRPWAAGGENTLENLRLLCAQHNTLSAIHFYGAEKMKAYRNIAHPVSLAGVTGKARYENSTSLEKLNLD